LITSNTVHDSVRKALRTVVPKLLWICTWVKVEVINNKTTWGRVKITGGKTYLSKKYKVSLKNTWSKSTIVCSV
jgi:hypothetical protein